MSRSARSVRSDVLGAILPELGNNPDAISAAATPQQQELTLNAIDDPPPTFSSETEQKNNALKAAIIEFEDFLETTNEVQQQNMESQRDLLHMRNEGSVAAIEAMDAEYRHPTPSYFNRDKLVKLLSLDVTSAILSKNIGHINKIRKFQMRVLEGRLAEDMSTTPSSHSPARSPRVTMQLPPDEGSRPSNSDVSPNDDTRSEARSAYSAISGRSGMTNLTQLPEDVPISVTRVDEILAELHNALPQETTKLHRRELSGITGGFFAPNGEALGSSLVTMSTLAQTDVQASIKQKVADTQAALQVRVDAALEHYRVLEGMERAGVEGEAVVVIDKQFVVSMQELEQALEILSDRLNHLMMSSNREGNFRSSYEHASDLIRAVIGEQRQMKTKLINKTDHDKGLVDAERNSRTSVHDAAVQDFLQRRQASIDRMRECDTRQSDLWSQIVELVKQMGVIHNERAGIVKEHTAATEVEWHRRRVYEEFMATSGRHLDHLEMLRGLGAHSNSMLDSLEDYFDHMVAAVEAKNLEDGTQDLRTHDQELFLKLYTPFVTTASELMARRNARLLLAQRSARIEKDMSKQKDNPDRELHTQSKVAADTTVARLTRECTDLEKRVVKWIPLFYEVKEAVESVNPDANIVDPLDAAEDNFSPVLEEARDAAQATTKADALNVDDEEHVAVAVKQHADDREEQVKQKRGGSARKQVNRKKRTAVTPSKTTTRSTTPQGTPSTQALFPPEGSTPTSSPLA